MLCGPKMKAKKERSKLTRGDRPGVDSALKRNTTSTTKLWAGQNESVGNGVKMKVVENVGIAGRDCDKNVANASRDTSFFHDGGERVCKGVRHGRRARRDREGGLPKGKSLLCKE